MKCADLYRNVIFGSLLPLGSGHHFPKIYFARNQMKCPGLHRNVMLGNSIPLGGAVNFQKRDFLLGLNEMLRFPPKKLCFKPSIPLNGVRVKCQRNCR